MIFVIIILGFLYGENYFKILQPYGFNDKSVPIGFYYLSVKWWNIYFNWYTRLDDWFVSFNIVFITNLRSKSKKEYSVLFSSTGIKTCIVNIN